MSRLGQFSRVLWVLLAVLTLALTLLGVPGRIRALESNVDLRTLQEIGISYNLYAFMLVGLNLIVVVFHFLVAGLLFIRRRNDRMALFLAFALISNGALIPLSMTSIPVNLHPGFWRLYTGVIEFTALTTSFGLLTLFPSAKFTPRWTAVVIGLWGAFVFVDSFFPASAISLRSWSLLAQIIVLVIFGGIGIFAQLYRFTSVSTPLERQQAKWAFIGLSAAFAGPFIFFSTIYLIPAGEMTSVPNLLYQRVGASYFAFALFVEIAVQLLASLYIFLLPLSFAIAILRYRLWDIDIIIRRTLIYFTLTGVLAAVYLSSLLLMQQLFHGLTDRSQLTVVFSTLISVIVSRPLWRKIQDLIDRNFYRGRYDAEKTLSEFGAALRQEVELKRLSEILIAAVQETVQPELISLWLRTRSGEGLTRQELLELVDGTDSNI